MIEATRRLLALCGVGRRRTALPAALGAAAVLCGVALLAASGYLVSRAAERPPILALTVTIVAVRFFGLARPVVRYLDRIWSHDLALRALRGVRTRLYAAMEPLAPAELDGFRRGDLLARMVADIDSMQGLYLRGVGPLLVALAVGVACVAAFAVALPAAAAVLAVGFVLGIVVIPLTVIRLSRTAGRRQVDTRAQLTADLVQVFRAAPELMVFGAHDRALREVEGRNRELTALGRRDAMLGGVGEGLSLLATGLTVVAVLAVGVEARTAGAIDRTLVTALVLAALASFEAVAPLPAAARELSATLAGGARVIDIFDREPRVQDPPAPCPPPATADVALENVTARYGDSLPPALSDVTLRLPAGRHVALTGASGAGKTTVVNLLLRFLDPELGCVTLAGRDARDHRQRDVRAMFAYAGQDAHIFDSSIRANLELGRAGVSEADINAALRTVRLHDWVAGLRDGLETRVGEEGAALSGGQRQRLGIARALLADAPVLLLDEPVAHLDPATAEAMIEDIMRAAGGRSLLLITHRSEGLDLVDEVVELADGRVVSDAV